MPLAKNNSNTHLKVLLFRGTGDKMSFRVITRTRVRLGCALFSCSAARRLFQRPQPQLHAPLYSTLTTISFDYSTFTKYHEFFFSFGKSAFSMYSRAGLNSKAHRATSAAPLSQGSEQQPSQASPSAFANRSYNRMTFFERIEPLYPPTLESICRNEQTGGLKSASAV